MSNYLHSKIDRLDDFRNPKTINYPKSNFKKHAQGYNQGSDKYEAQSKYRQTGPIVMGGGRYDTYYNQPGPMGYGTPVIVKQASCMEKCCACLGSLLCCMCLCDMLT